MKALKYFLGISALIVVSAAPSYAKVSLNSLESCLETIDKFYKTLSERLPIEDVSLDIEKMHQIDVTSENAPDVLALALLVGGDAPKAHKLFEDYYDPYRPSSYPNPYKKLDDLQVALDYQEQLILEKESAHQKALDHLQKDPLARENALVYIKEKEDAPIYSLDPWRGFVKDVAAILKTEKELELARLERTRLESAIKEAINNTKPAAMPETEEEADVRADLIIGIQQQWPSFIEAIQIKGAVKKGPTDEIKRSPYGVPRLRPNLDNLGSSFYQGQGNAVEGVVNNIFNEGQRAFVARKEAWQAKHRPMWKQPANYGSTKQNPNPPTQHSGFRIMSRIMRAFG